VGCARCQDGLEWRKRGWLSAWSSALAYRARKALMLPLMSAVLGEAAVVAHDVHQPPGRP